jgi:hypothetical protein
MSPLNRKSKTEQESGKSRRFTIRLPWDCAKYVILREKPNWTVTQEIESCVRLKMNVTRNGA